MTSNMKATYGKDDHHYMHEKRDDEAMYSCIRNHTRYEIYQTIHETVLFRLPTKRAMPHNL